jgi:ATP-dependent protease ClpP protease subunit
MTPARIELHGALDEAAGRRVSAAIRAAAGRLVVLDINSGGGRFGSAVDICLDFEEHDKAIVVLISGEACSAAALVALAGDRRFACKRAQIMVHHPSAPKGASWSWGPEERAAASAIVVDAIQAYVPAERSTVRKWMDAERYFGPREALAALSTASPISRQSSCASR